MTFEVRFLEGAEADLDTLPDKEREAIIRKTNAVLSENPHPHGDIVKRLQGIKPPLSRLRVGQWRVFFAIHGREVFILAVAKKERAERTIRRLRP